MKKQDIIRTVETLLEPIAEQMQYEIVDVEYEKEGKEWHLRVFADKEGGFSINDCVALSHALDEALEKEDPIEGAYHLEVSSPGLDRPLKKDKDFIRNRDKLVEVRLFAPIEACGPDKEFVACLKDHNAETKQVTLELEDGTLVTLDQKDIALIRLAVIF